MPLNRTELSARRKAYCWQHDKAFYEKSRTLVITIVLGLLINISSNLLTPSVRNVLFSTPTEFAVNNPTGQVSDPLGAIGTSGNPAAPGAVRGTAPAYTTPRISGAAEITSGSTAVPSVPSPVGGSYGTAGSAPEGSFVTGVAFGVPLSERLFRQLIRLLRWAARLTPQFRVAALPARPAPHPQRSY